MKSENSRALLAVFLAGLVLFSWQKYFAPNYAPQQKAPQKEREYNETKNRGSKVEYRQSNEEHLSNNDIIKENIVKIEKSVEPITLSTRDHQVKINHLLSISEFETNSSVFDFSSISGTSVPLKVELIMSNGEVVPLVVTKWIRKSSNVVKAVTSVPGVEFTVDLTESGFVQYNFTKAESIRLKYILDSTPKTLENSQVRQFTYFGSTVESLDIDDSNNFEEKVKWAGIDFNYHLVAFVFESLSHYNLRVNGEKNRLSLTEVGNQNRRGFRVIFTKKNYDHLVGLGHNMEQAVDFGIFGILAVPILRGLQFFYDFIPNYGVAIIILTLLIRLITFPLQYKSFKSMKKMQKLQPEIAKIKEKYEDDPPKMQKETMELFKKSGANPLGGCLPMLAQMPIFFAFYKVLYAAVELVGAPFYGWINDLSVKDPYFILPILMAVMMYLQQKITPMTSTDPTQQKVMMFLPLIFGFIMKDLPSGLVLYICVSTLFGILQQLLVYKTSD